jgi:cation transport ATPase
MIEQPLNYNNAEYIIFQGEKMKKSFKLEGLDCASCADKIQKQIVKINGVSKANLNFATCKLTIEGDESQMDQIIFLSKAIIKKYEPDVVVQSI